jgi:hypothetical protein
MSVDAVVGRLLYVYTFVDAEGMQSVEFIYEITNGFDFIEHTKKEKTHAHELSEVRWITKNEELRVLPEEIHYAFQTDSLPSETTYLKGSALDK